MAKEEQNNASAEEEVDRIFIEDEDGHSHEYEVIMYLQPDGSEHQYVILLQVDGEEDEEELEVLPFRFTEEGDELKLYPLESEEEWQLVTETYYALCEAEDDEDEEDTEEQPNHKG